MQPAEKAAENTLYQLIKSPEFQASPMSKIPKEVVLLIFKKLGVDDLISMRRVCHSFKDSGEAILKIAARQLKIPLKSSDSIKDISYFLKASTKLSALNDYVKVDGNSIIRTKRLTEDDRKKITASIEKLLAKYPDHPFSAGLKGVFSESMKAKYSDVAEFFNIAQLAIADLPDGSWVEYGSPLTSSHHYVYKDNGEVHQYAGRGRPDFQFNPDKELKYKGSFLG